MTKTRYAVALAALLGLQLAQPAEAQIRGSEKGSVSQTIDGTTITVEYSRPTARGRDLFGALVPWDIVWTPGANWATTLETDKDIQINGVEVAAGAYSVWMTPRQGTWTLTLNDNPEFFHFQKPDPSLGKYNIDIEAESANHMEMLTFTFPHVSGDAATLAFHWGETMVPMDILVEPSQPVILTADERAQFIGTYALSEIAPIPGWTPEAELRITEGEDGMLRGWMSFTIHPEDANDFDMIPAGMNRFSPGLYQQGKLFNVEPAVAFEFELGDDGKAATVVLRGGEGSAFGKGVRVSGEGVTR